MEQARSGFAPPRHGAGFVQLAAFLYVFSAPLDLIPLPVGSPVTITGAALLISWIAALSRRTVAIPRAPLQLAILGMVCIWSFATVLWSYAPGLSVVRSITTLLLVTSAVALASVLPGRIVPAAGWLAAGSSVAAVWTLISGPEMVNTPTGVSAQGQASFLQIDENALAFTLSLGLASALFVVIGSSHPGRRLLAIVAAAVTTAALILVGSRTGIGAMIAIGVLFVVASLRRASLAFPAVIALLSSLGVVRLLSAAGMVPPRVLQWLEEPVAMDSRAEIIEAYRLTTSEWLIRGVGAGADADYLFASVSWYANAHSAFWKTWIEQGLVGLSLWVLMFVGFAYWAVRSAQWTYFLLSSAPIGLFFFTLGPLSSNALWVVLGLALTSATPIAGAGGPRVSVGLLRIGSG